MSMLRGGRLPDTASGIYTPVTTEPLHRMPADPYLADSGVCQFAAAAALIGLGIDRGHWTATPADTTDPASGALVLLGRSCPAKVYLRSEERLFGKELASTGRSRGAPNH